MPIAFDIMFTLRSLLQREAWRQLETLSGRCFGLGFGEYRRLQLKAGVLEAYAADMAKATKNLDAYFKRVGSLSENDRILLLDELGGRLEALHGGAISPQTNDVLTRLAGGDPAFRSEMGKRCKNLARAAAAGRRFETDLAIAQMIHGLMGLFHSSFNMTYARACANGQDAARASKMSIGPKISGFESELRNSQRNLFEAVSAKGSRDSLTAAAETMASAIERALLPMAPVLAAAGLAARTLLQHGKYAAAKRLGLETLYGGQLAREAIASIAAGYAAAAACTNPQGKKGRRDIFSMAEGLAFDNPLPSAPLVQISDLSKMADTEPVTVEGFVSGLQVIRARDGKLLSRVELMDAPTQARTYGAGIYTHFSHIGLTKGAFCRLNGTFRRKSKLFPDSPLIEVQRMPLSSLSATSWRLRLIQTAQPWFRLFPNSINMSWALGPQRRPQKSGELPYNGAGELLYPPLVRH